MSFLVSGNEATKCPSCRSPMIVVSDSSSKEIVCNNGCGYSFPVEQRYGSGSEKFGRGPVNYGVLGNNLGMPLSTRNGNGRSELYYFRGCKGVFPWWDEKTGKVVANPRFGTMPGHVPNFEEPNKDVATFKEKFSRTYSMQSIKAPHRHSHDHDTAPIEECVCASICETGSCTCVCICEVGPWCSCGFCTSCRKVDPTVPVQKSRRISGTDINRRAQRALQELQGQVLQGERVRKRIKVTRGGGRPAMDQFGDASEFHVKYLKTAMNIDVLLASTLKTQSRYAKQEIALQISIKKK